MSLGENGISETVGLAETIEMNVTIGLAESIEMTVTIGLT